LNRDRITHRQTVTRRCKSPYLCGHSFDVDPAALRKGNSGYCDECNERYEEEMEAKREVLRQKISNTIAAADHLDSFLIPVTDDDPQPWATWENDFKNARWAAPDLELIVQHAHEGDTYPSTEFVERFDGARVFVIRPSKEKKT